MEKTAVFEHPLESGFPFIKLEEIQPRNRMKNSLIEEVVACSPVEIDKGEGSYFYTLYERGKGIFVRTMMGRSDHDNGAWVYSAEDLKEILPHDSEYQKVRNILKRLR